MEHSTLSYRRCSTSSNQLSSIDSLPEATLKVDYKEIICKKNAIVTAPVQSGKRDFIIKYSKECISRGINVYIILDNYLTNYFLLKESFQKENIKVCRCTKTPIKKKVLIKGLPLGSCRLDSLPLGSCRLDSLVPERPIVNQKQEPKIIVFLMNISCIKKINSLKPANIIIDEADILTNCTAQRSTALLKSKFNIVYLTASPKSLFFELNDIKCKDVYDLGHDKEQYVSYEAIKMNIIEYDKSNKYIKSLFDKCTDHTFINPSRPFNKVKGIFINVDRLCSSHLDLANSCFQYKGYVIINNGETIKVYHNGILKKKYKMSLPSVLYDIQLSWTISDYYLILIGSKKVSRGTPIRAELPQKPTDCNQMLLITNMIYLPSRIIETNIIQEIRLQGIYPVKNRPVLNLFTIKRVVDTLKNYDINSILTTYKQEPEELTITPLKPVSKAKFVKPYTKHRSYIRGNLVFSTEASLDKFTKDKLKPLRGCSPPKVEPATEAKSVLQACIDALDGKQLSSVEVYNIICSKFPKHKGLRNQVSHCLGHNMCFNKTGKSPILYSISDK